MNEANIAWARQQLSLARVFSLTGQADKSQQCILKAIDILDEELGYSEMSRKGGDQ